MPYICPYHDTGKAKSEMAWGEGGEMEYWDWLRDDAMREGRGEASMAKIGVLGEPQLATAASSDDTFSAALGCSPRPGGAAEPENVLPAAGMPPPGRLKVAHFAAFDHQARRTSPTTAAPCRPI